MCLDSTPDLEGFLALTDSITELIMNAPDSDQGSSDGNSSLSQVNFNSLSQLIYTYIIVSPCYIFRHIIMYNFLYNQDIYKFI